MNILVVGSGGREHALCWKLAQSPMVDRIICAPGNGGTALEADNVDVADDDLPGLIKLAKDVKADMVVAGPELPLVLGLQEALAREGIPCFGPSAYAANLEGSKVFSKVTMREAGVPTADFAVFEEPEQAKSYIREKGAPVVIKADGLAAGKGVVVAQSVEEAEAAVDEMMVRKTFGASGERIVVEECLDGEEASFLAFCDGENYAVLPSSQDHKAVGEGDTGPNTGGMGAYSPAPILPREKFAEVGEMVIRPILKYMAAKDQHFKGVLYAGLMFTKKGIMVLEYNVRFGDPECQPLMMRLDGDLAEIMLACVEGRLPEVEVKARPENACCVVLAAEGYPRSYPKGMEITGIEEAEKDDMVKVFQAGTRLEAGRVLTTGGRVLGVTALGDTLENAKKRAYTAVEAIHFDNCYYRRDIADKGLKRLKGE